MPIFNKNRILVELVTSDGQDQDTSGGQGATDYTAEAPAPAAPQAQDAGSGSSGGGEDMSTDYTTMSTDTPADAGAPAGNPGDPGATDAGGGGGEDMAMDYTGMDTSGGMDGGEGDPGAEGEDTGGDAGTDPGADGGGQEKSQDEIKQLEDELFASLSPEQLAIKNLELKNLYLSLYDAVDSLIVKINDLPKNSKYVSAVEFISDNLADLKSMVIDYLNNGTYASLSYTENFINYNKFVAVLQGINKLIEEIKVEEVDYLYQ